MSNSYPCGCFLAFAIRTMRLVMTVYPDFVTYQWCVIHQRNDPPQGPFLRFYQMTLSAHRKGFSRTSAWPSSCQRDSHSNKLQAPTANFHSSRLSHSKEYSAKLAAPSSSLWTYCRRLFSMYDGPTCILPPGGPTLGSKTCVAQNLSPSANALAKSDGSLASKQQGFNVHALERSLSSIINTLDLIPILHQRCHYG